MWAALGAAGLAAWLVLSRWMPSDDPALTVCWLRRVTHHDCATCGMTRALAHLAHGDVRGAIERHPLALPLALEAALLWLAAPFAIARRWRPGERAITRWILAHAAVLLLVWIVRLLHPSPAGLG